MFKKVLVLVVFILITLLAREAIADEGTTLIKVEVKTRPDYPPLKTGFLIDLDPEERDAFFYLGLEIYDKKIYNQNLSLDVGIASSRVLVGIGWGMFYNGTVGPFLWAGYNVKKNEPAFGVGFTVLKL